MFNMTDHLMRTADQQLWNNTEKREELWAADGGVEKMRETSPKESGSKRRGKELKKPLTEYEKEERNEKIKIRIAMVLTAFIITAMMILIIIWG